LSPLRSKRGWLLLGILILLGLFLFRPGVQRLRGRIAGSISRAIDRPVEIGSVSVHILPQPGFDLANFVVYDDPAFSPEPMLRSDDVTATLRVSSLFRGRIEISSLSLSEPSLNLVRNDSGHWNLEALLERTQNNPIAPTGQAANESRPEFPYIEADQGRINFKFGAEKKPYALTNADFSFWQESENSWGMRLKAQPVRTDFSLSDTGLLRVNGTWKRAGSLRQTPLQLSVGWDHSQLGQLTKLITGNDKGWRGTSTITASVTGTPADLGIRAQATVDDFRRYDIIGGGSLRLAANCDGRYHSAEHQFTDILCHAPVGDGALLLNGEANISWGNRTFHLALTAQDLPAQSVASFLRRVKRDLPEDMVASGKLNAIVRLDRDQGLFSWSGGGQAAALQLRSGNTGASLSLENVPFSFLSSGTSELMPKGDRRSKKVVAAIPANRVEIGPFEIPLGKPVPALVEGWLARAGYSLKITGDGQVQRLLQIARLAGLPVAPAAADGSAKVDLEVAGVWSGFAAPRVTGKAQLQAVRAELRGMNAPLQIASASVLLEPDTVSVLSVTASTGTIGWRGALSFSRPCGTPGACVIHFDLHADQLATDQLNLLLNPRMLKRPWYRFLSPDSPGSSYLTRLRAVGHLSADKMLIHGLAATKVSANVSLENGNLSATDLNADLFGGKHVGEWKANFQARPPAYSGSGKFEHVALGQLAEAMHDGWITGSASAGYQVTASGLSAAELFSSAKGSLQLEARDTTLPHIELGEQTGPLHMKHLGATLMLQDRRFEFHDAKLETPTGAYQLSGTATLGEALDLKLVRGGATGFNITGTLSRPRVAATTTQATEAVLKP